MSGVEIFTLQEVADLLKVPYDVVRKNVYAGRWPHIKVSPRNRRMSRADIDRVMEMLHHEPVALTRSETYRRTAHITELLRSI